MLARRLLLLTVVGFLAAASPAAAETLAPSLGGDPIPVGPDYNGGRPLPIRSGPPGAVRAQVRAEQRRAQQLDEVRLWPAIDDVAEAIYLKEFALRGVGEHIEVWVATGEDEISSGLRFPEGDCRNDERVEIGDRQIEGLIGQFDENIYPKESILSVPPARNGSGAVLPQDPDLGLPADYYAGEGDNIVVLVDNVRDANFYDTDNQGNLPYIAGFFASPVNELLDRNVMTIDAFDWIHRTGSNPPHEPVPGDLCESAPARPNLYEATFAHEYQHLLEYYADPDEGIWVNEGLSMWVETLTRYVDARRPITRVGFSPHVQCFLGYSDIQTDANPNPTPGGPENSLTLWGDQGDEEILCDYGAAYSFMEYLHGQYGTEFMVALHREDADGLAGLQAVLDEFAPGTDVLEVLHRWQAMVALDRALDRKPKLKGGSVRRYTTRTLRASINWDTENAYATPGAPPNGADYVRLRDADGDHLRARRLRFLSFDGSATLRPLPVEWTVDENPPEHPGDPALYSGAESDLDRSIVLPVDVPSVNPTLTFETLFATEPEYDFGFVQVSTDGGKRYTSLANADTTSAAASDAIRKVQENVPGFNGISGGGEEPAWITTSFDLSPYAGQTVLLAFRYISDPFVSLPGWWIDDIVVGGTTLSGGATLAGWQTITEISPLPVSGFTVQLVAYRRDGSSPAVIRTLTLDDDFDAALGRRALRRTLGSRADVVAAIVTQDDLSESVEQYAPYTLTVNGVVQPGG